MFNKCIHYSKNHSLFRNEAGEISVCDQSGDTPERTDDGPLVIQFKPALICYSPRWGISVRISVKVMRDGSDAFVSLNVPDWFALKQHMFLETEYSDEYFALKQIVSRI